MNSPGSFFYAVLNSDLNEFPIFNPVLLIEDLKIFAYSVDPSQMAPSGAIRLGSALFDMINPLINAYIFICEIEHSK